MTPGPTGPDLPKPSPMTMDLGHHQIACANCGEPLTGREGDMDIPCLYCGQRHRFLEAPETGDEAIFAVGDAVAVEWDGHWWSAHVVEVMANRWHVHFEGWAPAFDEVVGPDRIRMLDYTPGESIVPPQITVEKLEVKKASMFLAGGVVFALLVMVGFVAWWGLGDPNTADNPPGDTHRAGMVSGAISNVPVSAGMTIVVGQKFHVQWGDYWYVGTAIDVGPSGEIMIRYAGYGPDSDEVVPRDRLRLLK